MSIRRATAADAPAVVRMGLQFLAETRYHGLLSPNVDQLSRLIGFLLEHGLVLVAVREHAIVGMLLAHVGPHAISGELTGTEVAWWMDPAHRGGSAALRMLHQAEAWAVTQGAVRFQMIAPSDSTVGELYQRRGYEHVETIYQRAL